MILPVYIKLDKDAYDLEPIVDKKNAYHLRASEEGYLMPGESRLFDTGVYCEFPNEIMGIVMSDNNLEIKHKIAASNLLVENKKNIVIRLYNHSTVPYLIERGSRIALLTIVSNNSSDGYKLCKIGRWT